MTRPHVYIKDLTSTRPGCYLCGKDQFARAHQPLWWRWLHPGAESR